MVLERGLAVAGGTEITAKSKEIESSKSFAFKVFGMWVGGQVAPGALQHVGTLWIYPHFGSRSGGAGGTGIIAKTWEFGTFNWFCKVF